MIANRNQANRSFLSSEVVVVVKMYAVGKKIGKQMNVVKCEGKKST